MEKKIFTGSNTIFYNSQCLFVEYHDIIKSPWFVLLSCINDNPTIGEIFDLSEIQNLDSESLYEWYIYRKDRNIYKNFERLKPISDNDCDTLLESQMRLSGELYNIDTELNFVNVINTMRYHKKLIRKVIVYNETDNEFIRDDLQSMFGGFVDFVYGEFSEVLTTIPSDSTFVFSDANKVNVMAQVNKLNLASVLVCSNYRYNYIDKDTPLINLGVLHNKFTFKIDYFDNIFSK